MLPFIGGFSHNLILGMAWLACLSCVKNLLEMAVNFKLKHTFPSVCFRTPQIKKVAFLTPIKYQILLLLSKSLFGKAKSFFASWHNPLSTLLPVDYCSIVFLTCNEPKNIDYNSLLLWTTLIGPFMILIKIL